MKASRPKNPGASLRHICYVMELEAKNLLSNPMPKANPSRMEPSNAQPQSMMGASRVSAPPLPVDEAGKRVEELETEVEKLKKQIETYQNLSSDRFLAVVYDKWREDPAAEMERAVARFGYSYRRLVSVDTLHANIVCTSVKMAQDWKDKWINKQDELEKVWTDQVKQLKKDLYDNPDDDRTSKVVRFQNLYYSQLVCRPGTNLPDKCPYTGAVKTKAEKYKEEWETALADVERMKKLMPADDMSALLKSVKKKARTLKRKYANAKVQLKENCYIDSLDDKHCERDNDFSSDSDEELREEKQEEEPRMLYHDPSCPPGFRVRPASPV